MEEKPTLLEIKDLLGELKETFFDNGPKAVGWFRWNHKYRCQKD